MIYCDYGEYSYSNWECFFKSRACRRRYMVRSIIFRNNGGVGERACGKVVFEINFGGSCNGWGFWVMELF